MNYPLRQLLPWRLLRGQPIVVTRNHTKAARLGLEVLEGRLLLNASLNDSSLLIRGDDHDNTIDVSLNSAGDMIDVTIDSAAPQSFDLNKVRSMQIRSGKGSDTITLESAIAVAADVRGGEGNDDITTGDGADEVRGGPGNDTIDGGNEKNTIFGGQGDDSLTGGDNNDVIRGRRGKDSIDGGAGDDTLRGGRGNDSVLGGEGNDHIRGFYGHDTIDAGAGNDKVNCGGDTNDSIVAGTASDVVKNCGSNQGGSQNQQQSFSTTNLVADRASTSAAHTDANLINPWGIAFSTTGPFWVSDNGKGVATLYDSSGNPQSTVVTIPLPPGGTGTATPTGMVFNGTADFGVTGGPANFIFATEDGTITGWNSGTTADLKVDNSGANGAVYKGLAIGSVGTANFLYATNFRTGKIDVFDKNFAVATIAGNFTDPGLPAGFAPFGIQNIGGKIYVTYAKQDAAKHDDVAGQGNGIVSVFNTDGTFVNRRVTRGRLNSPWGLAMAPAAFGDFGGDLLVGNFGDGLIHVFNRDTGALVGELKNAQGSAVTIGGLWGLTFGNGGTAGSTSDLFFTAGPENEQHGLFGKITLNPAS